MKTNTSLYNPFDYLEAEEEINEYLNDAFRDDDPQVFLVALGHLARKQGMQEVARRTGLNRECFYKSISGSGNPHFSP